jgi:DNA-binding LacI/PurR family transcriptional regulator
MTVSRAINDKDNVDAKTKKRVLDQARQMGYMPNHLAKSLVSKKTNTIGVVVPEISHSFFPEVIRGIEEVAFREDYQIVFGHSSESFEREKKVIDMLRSKQVDGIMVSCSLNSRDYEFYENLAASGVEFVFFDRCIEEIGVSCIGVNDFSASKLITKHLINLGYKRIAHLSGPKDISIGKDRFEGFKKALEEEELIFDPKLIVESGFQESGGRTAMNTILDLPKNQWPDAIVAVNDPAAFGAIEALNDRGVRIPEDIAIVGFSDDIRAALLPVPLTTIAQPAYEVGRKAADKLIRSIENEKELKEKVNIMTELKIRSSCGYKLRNP